MIAAKITQEEKDSTRATVDEDRKHAIEAAIVAEREGTLRIERTGAKDARSAKMLALLLMRAVSLRQLREEQEWTDSR